MSSTDQDEVAVNLQAICHVTKDRAIELLGAASGSMERAIEIHFQQQSKSAKQSSASAKTNAAREDVISIDEDEEEKKIEKPCNGSKERQEPTDKIQSNHKTKTEDLDTKPSPSKKPRIVSTKSPSKAKGQGTLHAFFGVKKAGTNASPKKASSPPKTNGSTAQTRRKAVTPIQNGKQPASSSANGKQQSTGKKDPAPQKMQKATKPSTKTASNEEQQQLVDPRLSYTTLAKAFTEMVGTTKRNAKLNSLKVVIVGVIEAVGGIQETTSSRETDGQMLTCALELISGKISLPNTTTVAPVPLQVSGAAVSGALQIVTGGVSKSRMREAYRRTGDLGDCAAEFFSPAVSVKDFFKARKKRGREDDAAEGGGEQSNNNNKGASITHIHGLLQSVATVKPGTGSQKERQALLVKLLRLATSKEEMRFLVRILLGNMRLGATIKSILAALAMATEQVQTGEMTTPQCPAIQTLQKTHDICPRLSRIALALLQGGVERAAKDCTLELGVPVQPMLANPAHSLDEVNKLMTKGVEELCFHEAIAEWKYDGVRCQAHFDGTAMKLFSRHLLDTTAQFPDAAQFMLEARRQQANHAKQVTSFIIDAEIVAVSADRLLPFQVLSTRRGTKKDDGGVSIRVFAFDLMYMNGISVLGKPLYERQELLRESFQETTGFTFASSMTLSHYHEAELSGYLGQAVAGGAEGLMVKLTGRTSRVPDGDADSATIISTTVPPALPCPYESGTRSATWLKVKRDYVSGFADTIDVVPIGAWHGSGRKAEKGFLSPILFAVYDEDDGVFRSISRCMSFTDSMYTAIGEFYIHGKPYPADVGLVEGDSLKTKKKSSSTENDKGAMDAKDEVNGSEDEELEGNDPNNNAGDPSGDEEEDGDGDAFVGVNCFPARPSSSVVVTNESPTIWFKPSEVWEVSFADLSLSRMHTAAAGLVEDDEGRGVALRFPRFKRRRPDKGIEQATTCSQIAQLFTQQCKQC